MLTTNTTLWQLRPSSPDIDDTPSQQQPQQHQQHHSNHKNHSNHTQDRSPRYLALVQLLIVLVAFPLQSSNPISSLSRHGGGISSSISLRSWSVPLPHRMLSTTFATSGGWLLATAATSMVVQAAPAVPGVHDGDSAHSTTPAVPKKTQKPQTAHPSVAPAGPAPGPGGPAPAPSGPNYPPSPGSINSPKAAPSAKPAKLGTCNGQTTCTYSPQDAVPKEKSKPPKPGSDDDSDGNSKGESNKGGATAGGSSSMIMISAGAAFAVVAVIVGAVVVRKRRTRMEPTQPMSVGGRGEPFEDENYTSYDDGMKRNTNLPLPAGGIIGRPGLQTHSSYSSKASSLVGSSRRSERPTERERQPEQFWNP